MKPHSYSNKRRNTGVKAQSAMEYLMTYGWAILIIAVVIGVLFQMGVFSSTGSLGNSCLAQSGFLCSNPVLNSAGDLAISFGQFTGDKITITQIGCSSSTAEPTMHGTSIVLQNGQTNTETFSCPVPSSALGTQFTGTLWVTYTNTKGQSEVVEFATIAAKITQIGSAGATVIAYVPITITNSQTSPTPAPFQQQLIVDSASFTDINSNWQNVEFTTGPDGTGTLLNAWVETNPSNTATSTEVWVNLPTAIAGSGSQTIYMDMMSASI
ncbi:MAG: hypothetical protein M1504_02015, partial [Candidatus Marsarchaeota archaeon]|nr:hypothetical protein [Candidatus Marsarchaeota archaeon]